MPSPPFPGNPSVVPTHGDLPVSSPADVLAAMPSFVQYAQGAPAPVRDALVLALEAAQEKYQELSAYSAAQCDVLRATDQYLVGLGEDRSIYQQIGEAQDSFRARIIGVPSQVTPNAVLAIANAFLAPLTNIQAQLFESDLDRWYITDGTLAWHSFVIGGGPFGSAGPQYPDRMYKDDAALNNGLFRPQSDPGAAWAFSDELGRYFVLRVPVVADTALALIYAGDAPGFDSTLNYGGPLSGTVSVTNTSPAIVGTGTNFLVLAPGQQVQFSGSAAITYTISSIQSATALTLTSNFLGTTNAATTIAPASLFSTTGILGPFDTIPVELGGSEAGALESNGTVIVEPATTAGNFATTAGGRGFFIADGSNTSGAEADGSVALFLWQGATSALAIYQALVNEIERIKGHSVRWMLFVDPNLISN